MTAQYSINTYYMLTTKQKDTVIRSGAKYTSPYDTYTVDVHLSYYSTNHRHAIFIMDHETLEPIATATVNIPEMDIGEDQVIVKNYSENEGMLRFLIQEKIVAPEYIPRNNGYVTLYICTLLG